MRTFLLRALTLLMFVVVCQTGLALAGDVRWTSNGNDAVSLADDRTAVPEAPLPCSFEDTEPVVPSPTDVDCQQCGGCYCCCCVQPCRVWTFDYLVRPYFDTHTSYEFGTSPNDPDWPPPGYAPLSKLDFSLDSTWTGLRVGMETPTWGIHFEWLTPMQKNINGHMADFDWNILAPRNDPNRLDSLTLSSEKWNEGQMIDLGGEFKLTDCTFGLPVEIWPMLGFRWQRFNLTCYGIDYIVPPLGPQPAYDGVPVITFSQQYYLLYLGGQLRSNVCCLGRPVALTFQGDWAATWGYNVDHHLLRAGGDRYTMESTSGGSMHLALIAETQITCRLSAGVQADHLAIRTTGSHRMFWPSQGLDMKWTNGVAVKSDQTSITAFLRARY